MAKTFATYDEAIKSLPEGAFLNTSFGWPGEGGYTEFHRTPEGKRFMVTNGTYMATAPFTWKVEAVIETKNTVVTR